MGCGSSNSSGLAETPNPGDTKTKQDSPTPSPNSKASPKPTLMKADKFLSREEARERREKAVEEKQIRSRNNAKAISAQVMVDQERLSTSTRRSVQSFANSSTAAPFRASAPSTEESKLPEMSQQEGTGGPDHDHIAAAVTEAPQLIVEESTSVISSEDKEHNFITDVKQDKLVENVKTEYDIERVEQPGLKCLDDTKDEDDVEVANSEGGGGDAAEDKWKDAGKCVEGVSTMKHVNIDKNNSLESEKQGTESSSVNIEDDHIGNTLKKSLEIVTNLTETDKQGIGQRLSHQTDQELASECQVAPANLDVDERTIMDLGERVEVKLQQRQGVDGEASDGSDEGVADLDDVEDVQHHLYN